MADEVIIRDLLAGDEDTIAEIAVLAWTPIYAMYEQLLGKGIFEVAYPNALAEKAQQVREACDPQHRAMVYVAEANGRVVGFVTFYADDASGVGEIGNNAVHPEFQGRGLGRRMYDRVFERLRERGMRVVKVGTGGDPAHAAARRAYEKSGFSASLPNVTYYREL